MINLDYSNLTKTERYFADFIDKLIRDTVNEDLHWEKESLKSLEDFDYQMQHPLFKIIAQEDGTYEPKKFGYNSFFTPGAKINSDCYNVKIQENVLYLMNVSISECLSAKELYFIKWY